jgi:hypothetical protein
MYPWQQQFLNAMTTYKGKGLVHITGRGVGKSTLNSMFSGQALQRLMDDVLNRPVEDLILSQGTVYGSRYYTVEPVGGNWHEMELWCGQSFGAGSTEVWQHDMSKAPAPELRWYMNNRKFWFRNEKDRDWFVLRWRS